MGMPLAAPAQNSGGTAAMDLEKARDFWKTVVDSGAALCSLLDMPCSGPELQDATRRIGRVVQTLCDPAADVDPLLSVKVDQVERVIWRGVAPLPQRLPSIHGRMRVQPVLGQPLGKQRRRHVDDVRQESQ